MPKLSLVALTALSLLGAAAPAALGAQAPGRVTFPLPGATKVIKGSPPGSGVSALALRDDGGADVVGLAPGRKLVLARLTRAGALDTSFGSGGFIEPGLPSGLTPVQLLRQADGRLILIAEGPAGSKYQLPDFELARFNADGSLDTSFGTGGVVRLNDIQTGCADCQLAALTATGQIVLAAATGSISPDIEHNPAAPQNFRFSVVRLNANGSLDPTFGDKGVATLPGFGYAEGLSVQLSGAIVAFGVSGQTPTTDTGQLVRLTPLGTPDPTFNGGAAAALPFKAPLQLLLGTDGSALVMGLTASGAQEVARYTTLGARDMSYGTAGVAPLAASVVGVAARLVDDGGGRALVVSGRVGSSGPAGVPLLRLLATGQPDPALGGAAGIHVVAPFGGGDLSARGEGAFVQDSFDSAGPGAVARRADGSLLILGNVHLAAYTGEGAGTFINQAAAVSLTPSFTLDSAFGGPGALTLSTKVPTQRITVTHTHSKAYLNLSGVQVGVTGSQPGLARIAVRHGRTTIASGVVTAFSSGSQNIKVLLTATGRRIFAHTHHRHVTVTTTLRDLAANRVVARGNGVVS